MAAQFNHTIVLCQDKLRSATFLTEILSLSPPKTFGAFLVVEFSNGVSLDFSETEAEITVQHYAFLVSEGDFDLIFGRIGARELKYWADPSQQRPGEINHQDGGRGMYFEDPDGHLLEIITRFLPLSMGTRVG